MLPFRVFARLPRRANLISLAAVSSTKSLALNPFADPHTLTPIASTFYESIGGPSCPIPELVPRHSSPVTALKSFPFILLRTLLRFLALSCAHRKLNPFTFNRLRTLYPKTPGGGVRSHGTWITGHDRGFPLPPSSHCSAKPLVQQFAKVRDFFTIWGNNSALPGV